MNPSDKTVCCAAYFLWMSSRIPVAAIWRLLSGIRCKCLFTSAQNCFSLLIVILWLLWVAPTSVYETDKVIHIRASRIVSCIDIVFLYCFEIIDVDGVFKVRQKTCFKCYDMQPKNKCTAYFWKFIGTYEKRWASLQKLEVSINDKTLQCEVVMNDSYQFF